MDSLVCVADVIQPQLVMSAKQRRNPYSGPPNGHHELPEVRLEFPFHLIGKSTMAFFNRLIYHGAYSNPATQVEA